MWVIAAAAVARRAAAVRATAARTSSRAATKMQSCGLLYDGPSSALEVFKALHHPERKAAEKLLLTDGRQYGHLVNESVGFMAVPFSAFGSTVQKQGSKALERHG